MRSMPAMLTVPGKSASQSLGIACGKPRSLILARPFGRVPRHFRQIAFLRSTALRLNRAGLLFFLKVRKWLCDSECL